MLALVTVKLERPAQAQSLSIIIGQEYRRRFHILNLPTVENKIMPPNLNRITMFEGLSTDPFAVYLGAIGAPEILDIIIEVIFQIFVGLTTKLGMATADGRIVQLNVILRVASNADLILLQLVGTECYRFVL